MIIIDHFVVLASLCVGSFIAVVDVDVVAPAMTSVYQPPSPGNVYIFSSFIFLVFFLFLFFSFDCRTEL